MRHHKQRFQLNRFSSFRKATIKELAQSVLLHQKIITTEKKAKAVRATIEKIISLAKKNTLFARRSVYNLIGDHALVKTVFDEIGPLFSKRQSGFTRLLFWKKRRGDNAQLVILELTEKKPETKKKSKGAEKLVEKSKEETPQEKQPSKEKEIPLKVEKRGFLGGLRGFFKRQKNP